MAYKIHQPPNTNTSLEKTSLNSIKPLFFNLLKVYSTSYYHFSGGRIKAMATVKDREVC